ncbi:hypothetical protein JZ751_025845 [Albula glossodonta]|uniref:Ferric-chelate reductase 1 n=1 Tax=Albula glossodonta TaxID=121402 RepID=A0A8T2NHL4_9TELE|nr:hypothetical protein JZ751_025845 [Albula glossodonta]
MTRRLCILLAVATMFLVTAEGYRNGKVSASCDNMRPNHSHESNNGSSPYTITVDKNKFSPGDQIKVKIIASASGAKAFEGFLIEARDATNLDSAAAGTFKLVDPAISQLLKCGDIQGSAVSHTSKTKVKEIQVIWNAPKDSPPSIQFLATVVQHYNVFWVKIPGPVVTQSGVTPIPTRPTTTHTTTVITTPSVLPKPFTSDGCGSSKSCLRDPSECNPETDPKCFFLSFATEGQGVVFELSGQAEGYVSFALSLDKWMGNDDVYLCIRNGESVDIDPAYVKGRTHPVVDSQSELSDVAWRLADGVIQCKFRRDIYIPQDHHRFTLDKSYYLFLAHGRAEYGMVHKHDRQPLISANKKVITGAPENMSGSRSPLIMKFHAASTGIVFARYFKPSWPQHTIFGQKVWFQVHRTAMVLVVLLTCTAFVLAFIYRGGWSWHAGAHAYLGCTVTALTVLQPLMAIFRPPPDSASKVHYYCIKHISDTVERDREQDGREGAQSTEGDERESTEERKRKGRDEQQVTGEEKGGILLHYFSRLANSPASQRMAMALLRRAPENVSVY